jgi:hypothetical protein
MTKYTKEQLDNFSLEELKRFTDEQLKTLSIASLKSDLRMQEHSEQEDNRLVKFLKEDYVLLNDEKKAKYWSGNLFRSMRSQEESGLSPYAIFTEQALKEILKQEPKFIELLPLIYRTWGGMFDADKVDRIIQKHLKNISK